MVSVAEVLTAEYLEDGRRASWAPHLRGEFDRPYMHQLRRFLVAEESADQLLPQPECIFEALEETTLEEVKVVIIGQDPYPEPGQAHGLAFSTMDDGIRPPSLRNILDEVERDEHGCIAEGRNCLTPWARQGVLLLNRALTVRLGCARAHRGEGWEHFTDRIVETIDGYHRHVVFMLWGNDAQELRCKIDAGRHKVLCWRHPARGFAGAQHFFQANQYLEAHNAEPIDWLDVCKRPPADEQAAVPPLTSADADDEAKWDRAFAESIPQLERLAAEAAQERSSGLTAELDPSISIA